MRSKVLIFMLLVGCLCCGGQSREFVKAYNDIPGGMPKGSTNVVFLANQGYVAAYNEKSKCPVWVVYCLRGAPGKSLKRPSGFKVDDRTESKVSQGDYTRTGYDRGHMAPNSAIGRYYGADAQRETFLMSNVVPQKPHLNQRVWRELESREPGMAEKHGVVWVITGPVFDKFKEVLPSGVEIPDWCYKVIIWESGGTNQVLAVMVPRDVAKDSKVEENRVSVDKIEEKTGLDFFSGLPDDVEKELER